MEPAGSLSSPGASRAAALFPAEVTFGMLYSRQRMVKTESKIATGINPVAQTTLVG